MGVDVVNDVTRRMIQLNVHHGRHLLKQQLLVPHSLMIWIEMMLLLMMMNADDNNDDEDFCVVLLLVVIPLYLYLHSIPDF